MGKISIDFPQNLFLHLRSAKVIMENYLTPSYPSLLTSYTLFLCFITLPEDEVFRLCMASRDRWVVADLWSEDLRVRCMILRL